MFILHHKGLAKNADNLLIIQDTRNDTLWLAISNVNS